MCLPPPPPPFSSWTPKTGISLSSHRPLVQRLVAAAAFRELALLVSHYRVIPFVYRLRLSMFIPSFSLITLI